MNNDKRYEFDDLLERAGDANDMTSPTELVDLVDDLADAFCRQQERIRKLESDLEDGAGPYWQAWAELEAIGKNIPDMFLLDPPDGGSVELHEGVQRMADRIKELEGIIAHAWVHIGYEECGRSQMTSGQREIFDAIIDALDEEEPQ